jgi:hypothetical protein
LDSKLSIALYNQLESESNRNIETTGDENNIAFSSQSPNEILEQDKKKWKETIKNNLFSNYRTFCNFCADDLYFILSKSFGFNEAD